MKSTPFDVDKDIEPIPFTDELCSQAQKMKENGLDWTPHVGCFVWDPEHHIDVDSPFPNRIYFILNLGHFHRIFTDSKNMVAKLVWLPTWHQARLVAVKIGVPAEKIETLVQGAIQPGLELSRLYELINRYLTK